jgi:pyruvate kinase
MVRNVAAKCNADIATLADLQGPKIRTNRFPGGSIELENNSEIRIIHSEEDGKDGVITTTFAPLISDANVGDKILMDDGLIEMVVARKESDALVCKVIFGGKLKDRKGINLPNTKLRIQALTERSVNVMH